MPINPFLEKVSGYSFYNISNITLDRLGTNDTKSNLESYIESFSENVLDIFKKFNFQDVINRLDKANLLFLVCGQFAKFDLHQK
ncbi:hypothetical protein [Leptospira kirschneri]|uniref:Uncharacterized protein n=2 Tax=Leptospira kirschneri TaxID=29507 RepID=A0A0E2B6E4_9LEPT|nr:hypothetical protein [Leptospira kirschneri]EKO16782.1 hypothetical protein LEP1GSC081_2734 [Leptospira kirschneri str. H1]EMK26074.1 hypothetical protein LEP1GSC008_3634 [Leptospira kirschneri serovar Bulgarica str. Nikolaevo]UML80716.1 hypothetical protein FH602_03325 [Leptospira kirschneri]